jgi:hypothetical protein
MLVPLQQLTLDVSTLTITPLTLEVSTPTSTPLTLRISASENEKNRNMYSVMVYMLLNHENGLNITNIDIQEIEKIASQLILEEGVHIPKPNISDAWREMAVKYLQSNENKNEYSLHPVVYQAVLLSYSELFCEDILERC